VIAVRKVMRSLTAAMPRWLVIICGVCLVIPLARLAALVFTAAFVPGSASEGPPCPASAWKDGKSHRRADEMPRG